MKRRILTETEKCNEKIDLGKIQTVYLIHDLSGVLDRSTTVPTKKFKK